MAITVLSLTILRTRTKCVNDSEFCADTERTKTLNDLYRDCEYLWSAQVSRQRNLSNKSRQSRDLAQLRLQNISSLRFDIFDSLSQICSRHYKYIHYIITNILSLLNIFRRLLYLAAYSQPTVMDCVSQLTDSVAHRGRTNTGSCHNHGKIIGVKPTYILC